MFTTVGTRAGRPLHGGAQELIQEVITTGSQTNVNFYNIPQIYRDLIVRGSGRAAASATAEDILIQFNSDVGASYNFEDVTGFSTAVGGAQTVGGNDIKLSAFAGQTSGSGFVGQFQSWIMDYRNPNFVKSIITIGYVSLGTGTFTQGVYLRGGMWNSLKAINQIRVFLASGNFSDGSVVSLYGTF